ncbi:SANT and BTB domain regulator of class switch recombination [Neocloeon triangulifer]|uniref:SANT and BTB domain regulator of class switch recombination n=1 Tax=Neocloeon triangulifer TaxID=2078957 RepID=UPI00286EEB72|nr:SANT and BTB domain regulator of class switch recombination [Neocloeon triangulifer]
MAEAAVTEPPLDTADDVPRSKSCSDMSVQDFLDFLHSSYQLHQTVEAVRDGSRSVQHINWRQLLDTPTVQGVRSVPSGEQNDTQQVNNLSDQSVAKRKLHQVLQEGLLDSVLPYLVPKNAGSSAAGAKKVDEASKKPTSPSQEKPNRRGRHQEKAAKAKHKINSNAEVEIHVCDEVKGLKKTFKCPQALLVSEMGYFAEVTAGQKLDEMDISVHCDVANFEWLMSWVRREPNEKELWPKLDCSNVVAVLTSAAFLQMEELLEECLKFCHSRANELLAGPANLACINDSILSRLSGLFSNREVEQLRDRKDRLQGRLFCKLIAALAEPEADPRRGHFGSLAFMFECGECRRLIPSHALAHQIPCAPSATQIGALGELRHRHNRSSAWSLSDHVAELKMQLRTWRRVYWRLWGEAHWLTCGRCQGLFCLSQTGCCRLHPEPPQFVGGQRAFGRHPCCGLRVLRFAPVETQTGCQLEEHVPVLESDQDKATWALFQEFRSMVSPPPSPNRNFAPLKVPNAELRATEQANGGEEQQDKQSTMACLKLDAAKPGHGFLPTFVWELGRGRERQEEASRTMRNCVPEIIDSSESSSSDDSEDSGEEGEEERSIKSIQSKSRSRILNAVNQIPALPIARGPFGRHWDPNLSTRSNQDDQREYEERAVRRLSTWLLRRTTTNQTNRHSNSHVPVGGTFVGLEREWRDQHLRGERAQVHGHARNRLRSKHN